MRRTAKFTFWILFEVFLCRQGLCQVDDPFIEACKLPTDSSDPRRKTVDALIEATHPFIGYLPNSDCQTYERILFRAKRLTLFAFGLKDISPLAPLTQLEVLYLSVNGISDVHPLSSMTRLKLLALADNSVKDVSALKGLVNLGELELEGNKIEDIAPLAGLKSLGLLNISDNRVSSIEAVRNMVNLQALQIQDNLIQDIEPASNLPSLRFLYAYQNRINNVADFTPGASLFRINLSGNSIPDDQILKLQSSMIPGSNVVNEKQFNYTNRAKLLQERSASMDIQ